MNTELTIDGIPSWYTMPKEWQPRILTTDKPNAPIPSRVPVISLTYTGEEKKTLVATNLITGKQENVEIRKPIRVSVPIDEAFAWQFRIYSHGNVLISKLKIELEQFGKRRSLDKARIRALKKQINKAEQLKKLILPILRLKLQELGAK